MLRLVTAAHSPSCWLWMAPSPRRAIEQSQDDGVALGRRGVPAASGYTMRDCLLLQYLSFKSRLYSFPVGNRGISSMKSTERGHLKCAMRDRVNSISSAPSSASLDPDQPAERRP